MDDKTFGLIAGSEYAKEAWDTLQKIFEGSRYWDLKKEESDKILKRARSEISNEEDQERIRLLRALSTIVKTEGGTLQKTTIRSKFIRLSGKSKLNSYLT